MKYEIEIPNYLPNKDQLQSNIKNLITNEIDKYQKLKSMIIDLNDKENIEYILKYLINNTEKQRINTEKQYINTEKEINYLRTIINMQNKSISRFETILTNAGLI